MKDILHFSHANGFPMGSYKTLLSYLDNDYEIGSIDRLGHHDDYPVTNNWVQLVDELITELETSYSQPVFAVGHSLGGVLSFMVAAKRPDLIKGLIMLDAPFLTKIEAVGLNWSKRLGLIDKITPAARTLGRQEKWSSLADAQSYFRDKKLFKRFDERCLNDYINYGTVEIDDGERALHFDARTEIKIYRTIPDNLHKTKKLAMPAVVFAGDSSDVFKKHHGARMKRQLGMKVEWLKGGHMFPFERPQQTAELIKHYLSQWK